MMRVLILLVSLASSLAAQGPPKMIGSMSESTISGQVGIQPLTATTLAEAITLGSQKSADDLVALASPALAFLKLHTMLEVGRSTALTDQYMKWTSMPYTVTFHTPFVAAASAVSEAQRKFLPAPALDLTALNGQDVVVSVTPGGDFTTATAIENVVIKRGAEVIRPTVSKVTPTTIRNRMGASREVTEGQFTFKIPIFAPTGPILLILVGPASNIEIEIGPEVLKALR
jgi:hypothetical protein